MSVRKRRKSKEEGAAWKVASWAAKTAWTGIRRIADASQSGIGQFAQRAAEPHSECKSGNSFEPELLSDFIGQKQACDNLSVFVRAARLRDDALDNVLIAGPPGLGKTCLARIIARELGVRFHHTTAPSIGAATDLAGVLLQLKRRDVLFIDEIHRLTAPVEESLYPAIEQHCVGSIIGKGAAARLTNLRLAPFTLIAATTRPGLLSRPLRDRFGILLQLTFYETKELEAIICCNAQRFGIAVTPDGSNEIARRSRGTPRVAIRLLRRVRDFAEVQNNHNINRQFVDDALQALEIDSIGLDATDRRYISAIAVTFDNRPVGIETISAAISEPRESIEDIIEPFLLSKGFIERTARGRQVTSRAFEHLRLARPASATKELGSAHSEQTRSFNGTIE